ncbi:MAG: hypothetical protein ACK4UP_07305 [Spirosomataceae bacterium]
MSLKNIIFLLLTSPFVTFGQQNGEQLMLPDTLQERSSNSLSLSASWDSRVSVVNQKRVPIWGMSTGFRFGEKRHSLSVGYYWMNTTTQEKFINLKKTSDKPLVNWRYYTQTDIFYYNFIFWPNWINNRRFRFSTPLEIGIGSVSPPQSNLWKDIQIWKTNQLFLPAQAGFYAEWKTFRYVGLFVQGGYRYTLLDRISTIDLNGYYYSFGYTFYTLTILEDSLNLYKKYRKKRKLARITHF